MRKQEARFRDWGNAHLCALSVTALWGLVLIAVDSQRNGFQTVSVGAITAGFLFAAILPLCGFWSTALANGKLPSKRPDSEMDGEPKYRHISGQTAFYFIIFVVLVSFICVWAISQNAKPHAETKISGVFGIIVISVVMFAFIFFAHQSYRPGRPRKKSETGTNIALIWIGRGFSIVDSWLALPVANAVGMQLDKGWRRHLILIGTLTAIPVLAWHLPGSLALVPLAWAFLLVLGITRQWAWVEDDREIAMLKRSFDQKDLRIGFAQDLRDEALVAYALMLLMVPVALRAVFLNFGGELDYSSAANNGIDLHEHSYWAWMSLFGTELAKAVPFVDWAEIFQVEGAPYIVLEPTNANYQLVIFATRVLVDLLLLAALVQAISIVSRTQKQKQLFFVDQTLSQLDPFIEPIELRHLVLGTPHDWRVRDELEFKAFPRYDEDRLHVLAKLSVDEDGLPTGKEKTPIEFIARKLLLRDKSEPAEAWLNRYIRSEKVDSVAIDAIFKRLETQTSSPDVDTIMRIMRFANDKPTLLDVRMRLANTLMLNTAEPSAIMALIQILTGLGRVKKDSRKEVRLIALKALILPAMTDHLMAQSAIADAAANDTAPHVRSEARALLDRHDEWFKIKSHAKDLMDLEAKE